MYEHGIAVLYELRDPDTGAWGHHGRVTMPGWCAGDPAMAVALHFHGQRDAVELVRVVDWQPLDPDDPGAIDADDDDREDPHGLLCAWLDGDHAAGLRLLSQLALDPARVYRAVR